MTRNITREDVERATDELIAARYDFEDRGIFYIDPATIPPGVRYEWKNETVLGEYQRESLQQNLRRGWTIVPAQRHPELVPPPMPGQERETAIRTGGHILMEMAEDRVAAFEQHQRDQTAQITRAKEVELGNAPAPNLAPRLSPTITQEVLPPGR